MSSNPRFPEPVIIVGAPRSGTSLLQKIVREIPAFVSVPRESSVIWWPYVHPKENAWRGEGLAERSLSAAEVAEIREAYSSRVLSAKIWSGWSQSKIMSSPHLSKLVRSVYPFSDRVLSGVRRLVPKRERVRRLVDKSVHFPFWLSAINQVFPDARFIHITRDGPACVCSMMKGWLDPERFNTYEIPAPLRASDIRYWCFPMPPRWREYLQLPLAERVARQWVDIQTAIDEGLTVAREQDRYLHIKLEDLISTPRLSLERLAEFIDYPWDDYFEDLQADIPIVNAGPESRSDDRHSGYDQPTVQEIIEPAQRRLGYKRH